MSPSTTPYTPEASARRSPAAVPKKTPPNPPTRFPAS
jgi:hypothetical protein